MTTTISQFTRRVSFNNLESDQIEPIPSPSPYTSQYATASAPSPFKPNYTLGAQPSDLGYGNTLFNDISKAYTQAPIKRKLRLPDPPEKSILKNKVSPQYIATETINYHGDVEAAANAAANALGEADLPVPSARRKSYSDMTFEELNALDPQYQTTKPKTSDVNQFKFDLQKQYYLPARKASSTPAATQKGQEYPTSNENNYKSISLTVKHKNFDNVSFMRRSILTVILGRRHTWNALDFLFEDASSENKPHNVVYDEEVDLGDPTWDSPSGRVFQDGDHIIVAALIPLKFLREFPKRNKKIAINDYLYKKAENLLEYITSGPLLSKNKDLKLKITVEFVTDCEIINSPVFGYKYMLKELFEQYQPSLVVLGNKSSNLNFKYPKKIRKNNERDEYLIKLSSYVIKYSTVPVVLVGNSTYFQNKTGNGVAKQSLTFDLTHPRRKAASTQSTIGTTSLAETTNEAQDPVISFTGNNDRNNDRRGSSTSSISISSNESTGETSSSPPRRVTKQDSYSAELESIADAPNTEDKFVNWISLISDKSALELKNYLAAIASKDDSLKIDLKIHAIYRLRTNNQSEDDNSISRRGSHDSGNGASTSEKIYKVKSLISYSDKDEMKNEKLRNDLKTRRKSSSGKKPVIKVEEEKKGSFWQKLKIKK